MSPHLQRTVFKTGLQGSISRHIPHKTPKKTDSYPWITTDIKKLIRKSLYSMMKKHGTEDLKAEVRKLRRKVQKKLRRAHWDYVCRLFKKTNEEDHTPSLNRFWTYIRHQRAAASGVPRPEGEGSTYYRRQRKGPSSQPAVRHSIQ